MHCLQSNSIIANEICDYSKNLREGIFQSFNMQIAEMSLGLQTAHRHTRKGTG